MFLTLAYVLFTLFISYVNATSVGRYWTEKRYFPTGTKVLLWSGAIMAWIGFFIAGIIMVTMAMYDANLFVPLGKAIFKVTLTPADVEEIVTAVFNLAYLGIIIPLLGTGLVITINSWLVFKQQRGFLTGGVAVYNTYAQVHNFVSAARYVPSATKSVAESFGKIFKNKNSAKSTAMLFLITLPLALSAIFATFTTLAIMRSADAKYELEKPKREEKMKNDWA